jgi:hypothetical protein
MMLAPLPSDACEKAFAQPLSQGRLTFPMADIKAKKSLLEVPATKSDAAARC